MGNQEYFDSELNPETRVFTSMTGGRGENGESEGDCHKFARLRIKLELFASQGDLLISGGGIHNWGGECNTKVPYDCSASHVAPGFERPLDVGEQSKKIKTQLFFDGRAQVDKEKKLCEPCDDSTARFKRDALDGLLESLEDDDLNALKDFMNAICSPGGLKTGGKDVGMKLIFDVDVTCYKEFIKLGCRLPKNKKDCKLGGRVVYGEGYGDSGSGGFSTDILSLLTKYGNIVDLSMLCPLWEEFKSCLFQDGGDGDPKPGIGKKVADCVGKHLTAANFAWIALKNALNPFNEDDRMEIIAIILDQMLKCLGCATTNK